jgi:hypothetical protein
MKPQIANHFDALWEESGGTEGGEMKEDQQTTSKAT